MNTENYLKHYGYSPTTDFKTENGVTNEHIIEKYGQQTQSGGIIHNGSFFTKTEMGLDPLATYNSPQLKRWGYEVEDKPNIQGSAINLNNIGLPDGTVINDTLGITYGRKDYDIRPVLCKAINYQKKLRSMQLKAATIAEGGAGTAPLGIFAQYFVDQNVIDTSRKYTPMIEMWAHVANFGPQALWNKLTAKGSAAYLQEDSALVEASDTESQSSANIKFAYAVGRITEPAKLMQSSFIMNGFYSTGFNSDFQSTGLLTPKQRQITIRTQALQELRENTLINGDSTAHDYSGLITTQSTTNKLDLNGREVQISDINDCLNYAYVDSGRPTMAYGSPSAINQIMAELNDKKLLSSGDRTNIFGQDYITFLSSLGTKITFVPSQYISDTAGSRSIYFVDMRATEIRESQPIMYVDLARTSDSEKFYLKVYDVGIFKNTSFNAYIGEIA